MKLAICAILAMSCLTFAKLSAQSSDRNNDGDNDGINDANDLCSNTLPGSNVWKTGEWMGCAGGQIRDRERPTVPINSFQPASRPANARWIRCSELML